ncbi:MAG: AAA family ATPase, partial [Bryobacteraceae bacterium]
LVEISGAAEEALAVVERLSRPPWRVPVIAVLDREDPELALRSMRRGACGCLVPPYVPDQLRLILSRALRRAQERPRAPSGNVLCIAPAKGACGATVLAITLADQLRRAGAQRLLLADFDPVVGGVAFNLKLSSPHSFADALRHASQLDADLWRGLVASKPDFDVLLAPDTPVETDEDPASLALLLSYARRNYEWILADAGSLGRGYSLELARLCDTVLFLLTPDLASLYAAKRWLPHLMASGLTRSKIRLVMNRWNRSRGIDAEGAAEALGWPVDWTLPEDPYAVQTALIEGKPVAAASAYAKHVKRLAESLLQESRPVPWPPSSKGLLSLFSGGF